MFIELKLSLSDTIYMLDFLKTKRITSDLVFDSEDKIARSDLSFSHETSLRMSLMPEPQPDPRDRRIMISTTLEEVRVKN